MTPGELSAAVAAFCGVALREGLAVQLNFETGHIELWRGPTRASIPCDTFGDMPWDAEEYARRVVKAWERFEDEREEPAKRIAFDHLARHVGGEEVMRLEVREVPA